jgi:nicotinate phosphoribosyltransferase
MMSAAGQSLALLTDLYQLTMAACYFEQGMAADATFSLFIRKYPAHRGYFVAAGLEEALCYLETLRFSQDDLAYLESTRLFNTGFLEYLEGVRFTGQVHALPEGAIFFKDEPILEITAPILEAQLVETCIINAVSLQTLIASKAARSVHAAQRRPLIDFSLRRTHGSDAGLKVAKASYLTGFAGASNVLAGKIYGIPIFGTMAHSFITSFPEEVEAFRVFAKVFPNTVTLLIDTYDNAQGARHAAVVGHEMAAQGQRLRAVRLDSGDLLAISREVRQILDEQGLDYVRILASGGLDEHEIAALMAAGAPIDSFAVGTKMGVAADAPYFDIAYKLVQYAGRPVMKLSTGKATLVSQKQVWRTYGDDGAMVRDVIALRQETMAGAEPRLQPVMRQGRRISPPVALEDSRRFFQAEFARLPDTYKDLTAPAPFPVDLSPGLAALQAKVTQELQAWLK